MLFGEYLVKYGNLTQDQIDEALGKQAAMSSDSGKKKLIGDILVELGYIEKEKVDEILIQFLKDG